MEPDAMASLYDATAAPAWRLACLLAADETAAADLVVRTYRTIAVAGGRVPPGRSPAAHVLALLQSTGGPRRPALHPA